MRILEEYKTVFKAYTIPKTLKLLAEFEEQAGSETFNESFYLGTEENAFDTFFDDDTSQEMRDDYTDHMLPFGVADGTGGFVCFWVREGEDDLEKAPIICYGSEGSIDVVAQNLTEFIEMLSFGAECMDASFYHPMDDYDEDSDFQNFKSEFIHYNPNFLAFRVWMKETLNITPVPDWEEECSEVVDALIENAVEKLTKDFDVWQYQYYLSQEDSYKAYVVEKVKEIDQELIELSTTLKRTPHEASLHFKEAKLLIDKSEMLKEKYTLEQQLDLYEKVLKFDENFEEVLWLLANLYEYKDREKSLAYLQRIEALDDSKKDPLSAIGSRYESLGLLDKALACYIKDVERAPNVGGYSQTSIMRICKKLNRDYFPILITFTQTLRDPFSCNVLFEHCLKEKDYAQALTYYIAYDKAKERQYNSDYIQYAETFFKKEAFVEAKFSFKMAIENMDDSGDFAYCYNYLAIIANKKDSDIEEAIRNFQKAVELKPDSEIYHENLNYWLRKRDEV